jgi:hypothetical protein
VCVAPRDRAPVPSEFDVDRAISGERRVRSVDRAIAEIAAKQNGTIHRRQLRALGLSDDAIDWRIATGRLHVIHRGVYAVGHARLTRQGRWMAAVLAGGKVAALSNQSSGALLGLISYSGPAHVTVPRSRRRQRGIVWHTSVLPADEIEAVDGIPATTPARTLLDLASVLDKHRLARAIDRAEANQLTSPTSLIALMERYPGRRGIAKLREILDEEELGRRITKSDLEDLFLSFVDRYGLPRPETNVWLSLGDSWVEVDCLWRDPRLIVELDSRGWHDTKLAFDSDRARDRRLIAAGWRVVRVTWRQLTHEPVALAADLHAAVQG